MSWSMITVHVLIMGAYFFLLVFVDWSQAETWLERARVCLELIQNAVNINLITFFFFFV